MAMVNGIKWIGSIKIQIDKRKPVEGFNFILSLLILLCIYINKIIIFSMK